MRVRIVLLPDKNLEKIAKDSSLKIFNSYPSFFKLDEIHIPHATLTAGELKDKDQNEISGRLEKLAKKLNKLKVVISAIRVEPTNKSSVGFYFKENTLFESLREEVSGEVKDLLSGTQPFLDPHITLTKLKNENDSEQATKLINLLDQEFNLGFLALCEDSDYGVCKKLLYIQELNFKS